jgi:hypothetical protein
VEGDADVVGLERGELGAEEGGAVRWAIPIDEIGERIVRWVVGIAML